jgi:hypothetical protein
MSKKLYNVVTNKKIIDLIKSNSKYFKVNLGFSSTDEDRSGERVLSTKDEFAFSYNAFYKTFIYAQGNIGNIRFYTDHYIMEDVLAVYLDLEEFIFNFDQEFYKEKGIDALLGKMVKEVDDKMEQMKKDKKEQEEDLKNRDVKKGDADKVFTNPGNVRYEDIKAYLDKKNNSRI